MTQQEQTGDADRLVSVADAARAWGVSDETVRRWCKQGKIPYEVVGPFRLRRIRESEIERQRTKVERDGAAQ